MSRTETTCLSYTKMWEAWWRNPADERDRELRIGRDAFTKEGYSNGCIYEFFFREYNLNGLCVRLEMFEDAFYALLEPDLEKFWKNLPQVVNMDDLLELLDSLKIPDKTPRERDNHGA